ncbi:MAG: response regulator [Planctomycetes bacterium]|nr:response regulator [Planctomycetota bacterium]MBM4085824.1 response regulator [Planctomycetota bacterium]
MSNAQKRVLVIDDDPDVVEPIRLALEAAQYAVASAGDTKEGLEKIRQFQPHLIILDIMMEGKAAGIIFSRQLRQSPETAQIPVLMLTGMTQQTGFSFPGATKDARFLPVDEYVEKPIDPRALVEKVKRLLSEELTRRQGDKGTGRHV